MYLFRSPVIYTWHAVALMVLVGCGSDLMTDSDVPTVSGIPFIQVPDPPSRQPPPLKLIDDNSECVAVGQLYEADWGDVDRSSIILPLTPVVWPAALPRNGAATLEFISPVPPTFVSFQLFLDVEQNSQLPINPLTGELTDVGEIYRECRTNHETCIEFNDTSARWSAALPEAMFKQEYITVYAEWIVPPSSIDDLLGSVSASWLFHFVNE